MSTFDSSLLGVESWESWNRWYMSTFWF